MFNEVDISMPTDKKVKGKRKGRKMRAGYDLWPPDPLKNF